MRAIFVRPLAAAGFLATTFAPSFATPLITNGSFEQTTATASTYMTSSNVTGWGTTSGYTFITFPGQAGVNLGNPGDTTLYLAGNPPATSPDGGNAIVSDANYNQGYEYQAISGLTPGTDYTISFYQAAGQQHGFAGNAENTYWQVGFGAAVYSNSVLNVASSYSGSTFKNASTMSYAIQTFYNWTTQQLTFRASSAVEFLSFYAMSSTSGAQPPFALLDGVSMVATPEPASLALLGVGLAALAWRRRRA